jgi:large subunit ribosomal protein L2
MVKIYKPTTSTRRKMSVVEYKKVLTVKKPFKKLTTGKKSNAGRANGKVSVRHKGGGHKRKLRIVDFKQNRFDIPAKVETIEYDPNRSAFLALIKYQDGKHSYILSPDNLKVGDEIITSQKKVSFKIGNRMSLKNIQVGTMIHNIEMIPGKGGQLAKSAGSYVTLGAKEKGFAQITLPSSEIRIIPEECLATIGQVSNLEHSAQRIGKAGRKRWLGIRPTVRGTAMAPNAHPHGGGEGRTTTGLKYPKTPWGKCAYGKKTRKKNKRSNKYIIKGRKRR